MPRIKPLNSEDVNSIGSYSVDNTYIDKHIEKILKLKMVDVEAIKQRNFKNSNRLCKLYWWYCFT